MSHVLLEIRWDKKRSKSKKPLEFADVCYWPVPRVPIYQVGGGGGYRSPWGSPLKLVELRKVFRCVPITLLAGLTRTVLAARSPGGGRARRRFGLPTWAEAANKPNGPCLRTK
jgi:hypothetical protein